MKTTIEFPRNKLMKSNFVFQNYFSHHAGSFVGVSEVKSQDRSTAVLISPVIRESSATCRLRLRYFLWDSGKGHCLASLNIKL